MQNPHYVQQLISTILESELQLQIPLLIDKAPDAQQQSKQHGYVLTEHLNCLTVVLFRVNSVVRFCYVSILWKHENIYHHILQGREVWQEN